MCVCVAFWVAECHLRLRHTHTQRIIISFFILWSQASDNMVQSSKKNPMDFA